MLQIFPKKKSSDKNFENIQIIHRVIIEISGLLCYNIPNDGQNHGGKS